MFDIVISGGLAVLPSGPEPADIGVADEHIAAIGAPGSLSAIGAGRTVDAAGQITLGGYFFGQLDLGGGPLTSAGSTDGFLARLDPSGAHVWSKSFGGPDGDQLNGLVVDAAGNVAVAGAIGGRRDDGPRKLRVLAT